MDAQAWDERYAAAELVWSSGPNAFVEQALTDLSPGVALDLACGEGRNALWLAGRGWEVHAIDFARVAVDRGRALATARGLQVHWEVADVLTVTLPPADLALLSYLHLPPDQRRTAVRRAVDALRRGGTFLLVAHDSTNLRDGTGGPQDPDVLYTAEEVLDDLYLDADPLPDLPMDVLHASRVPRAVTSRDEHGGEQHRTAWDVLVHLRKR